MDLIDGNMRNKIVQRNRAHSIKYRGGGIIQGKVSLIKLVKSLSGANAPNDILKNDEEIFFKDCKSDCAL